MPKLFLDVLTPDSRALLVFFTKCSIPCLRHDLDMARNKNMTAEYRQVSPEMKCPVLRYGNIVIDDAIDIMKFFCVKAHQIDESHRIGDLYNLANQMEIRQINSTLEKYKRFCASVLGSTYNQLKIPLSPLTSNNVYLFTATEVEQMKVFLSLFEKEFLKKEHLANHTSVAFLIDPDILTIADIYIICDLANLRLLGIDLQRFPLVYTYISRYFSDSVFMSAHSQFLLFCETKANTTDQNFALKEVNKKLEERNNQRQEKRIAN